MNVDETVVVLRRVLEESGHRDFTIDVFHHVGHDMHVTIGEKPGVVAPEYLDAMRTWLGTRIR